MNTDLEPYQGGTPEPYERPRRKPTKAERRAVLLAKLREAAASGDTEGGHLDADQALLGFINDAEITAAYEEIPRWYA
jgi:hypothetical protein